MPIDVDILVSLAKIAGIAVLTYLLSHLLRRYLEQKWRQSRCPARLIVLTSSKP